MVFGGGYVSECVSSVFLGGIGVTPGGGGLDEDVGSGFGGGY